MAGKEEGVQGAAAGAAGGLKRWRQCAAGSESGSVACNKQLTKWRAIETQPGMCLAGQPTLPTRTMHIQGAGRHKGSSASRFTIPHPVYVCTSADPRPPMARLTWPGERQPQPNVNHASLHRSRVVLVLQEGAHVSQNGVNTGVGKHAMDTCRAGKRLKEGARAQGRSRGDDGGR